jgi:hypothetical protein
MGLERRGRVKRSHDEATGNRRKSLRCVRQTDQPFDWRVCLMEPDEPRGSRPVLREAGGAIPPAYSPGAWLSSFRMVFLVEMRSSQRLVT